MLLSACLCNEVCVNVSSSLSDVNECTLGEVDCSPWADCEDRFGSYTCVCRYGYTDVNPERPGRTCQGTAATSPGSTFPFTANGNLKATAESGFNVEKHNIFPSLTCAYVCFIC